MASILTLGNGTFTSPQRRLLGGWRDVLDDVRELSRSLREMPDQCQCGDGTAHLSGSCACCQTRGTGGAGSCKDCGALLVTCAAKIDELLVDTLRLFPAFTYILAGTHPPEIRSAANDVQLEIAALVRTFESIAVAADAFRAGCRASHVPTLKRAAVDLHAHAERLDRLL